MALSGSVMCRVHRALDFEFVWNAAQDPSTNGSWIYWHTFLRAGSDGWIQALPGSAWETVIDGQVFSDRTDISVNANSAKELASGKVFLKHDAFGEKRFDFSFSQVLNITFDGVYTGEITGGGSAVLDRIDPDVTPGVDKTEVYLGDSLEITPKGPIGATYRLRYAMGGAEGIIAENVTGTFSWVVPEALGAQIPYTDKGTLRILCQAYREGEPFGRDREATVLARVPEWALPEITDLIWEDESPAKDIGLLIQNISDLKVSAHCEGAMGSRIMSCYFFLDGNFFAKGKLKTAGDITLEVVTIDSRNRRNSRTAILSVVPYTTPYVYVTAHRCLEDGTADDTGGFAQITISAEFSEFDGNYAKVKLSAGSFSDEQIIPSPQTLQWTIVAPEESTVGISVNISDLFSASDGEMVLSTAYATIDLLYGGKGIAFGTTALQEGFWCAMDANFTGKTHLAGTCILNDGTDLLERLKSMEEKLNTIMGSNL